MKHAFFFGLAIVLVVVGTRFLFGMDIDAPTNSKNALLIFLGIVNTFFGGMISILAAKKFFQD